MIVVECDRNYFFVISCIKEVISIKNVKCREYGFMEFIYGYEYVEKLMLNWLRSVYWYIICDFLFFG